MKTFLGAAAPTSTLCTFIILSSSILSAVATPNAEPAAAPSPAPTPAPNPVAFWNLPFFGKPEEADLKGQPAPGLVPVGTHTFDDNEVVTSWLPLDRTEDPRLRDYCRRHDCANLREEAAEQGWQGEGEGED